MAGGPGLSCLLMRSVFNEGHSVANNVLELNELSVFFEKRTKSIFFCVFVDILNLEFSFSKVLSFSFSSLRLLFALYLFLLL